MQIALGDSELRPWLFHRDDEVAAGGFDAAIRSGTGGLVVVGPEVVSPRGYYLTWREGSPSPKVQSIIDWLETELR